MNKKIMVILLMGAYLCGLILISNNVSANEVHEITITALPENCGFEQWGANTFDECNTTSGGGHSTWLDYDIIPVGNDLWQNETWVAIYRGCIGFNTSLLPTDCTINSVTLNIKSWNPAVTFEESENNEIVNVYNRPNTEISFNWTEMYNNYSLQGELVNSENIDDDTWYNISISTTNFGGGDFSSEYGSGVDTVYYLTTPLEETEPTLENFLQTFVFDESELPYLTITYEIEEELTAMEIFSQILISIIALIILLIILKMVHNQLNGVIKDDKKR